MLLVAGRYKAERDDAQALAFFTPLQGFPKDKSLRPLECSIHADHTVQETKASTAALVCARPKQVLQLGGTTKLLLPTTAAVSHSTHT